MKTLAGIVISYDITSKHSFEEAKVGRIFDKKILESYTTHLWAKFEYIDWFDYTSR